MSTVLGPALEVHLDPPAGRAPTATSSATSFPGLLAAAPAPARGSCRFCGAAGGLVPLAVLDEKWWRRFGGVPAVALDHGWFRTADGRVLAAPDLGAARTFSPDVRVACDWCVHGWVEDVRWRAEPLLLARAEQCSPVTSSAADMTALVRWMLLTALLAEMIDGMPSASGATRRDAARRGVPAPEVRSWAFATRQRLPTRIHLSQVRVAASPDAELVQVVSVDIAHFTALVVLPSQRCSGDVVARAALEDELGPGVGEHSPYVASAVDLSRTRHPHRTAVDRLCRTSAASGPAFVDLRADAVGTARA